MSIWHLGVLVAAFCLLLLEGSFHPIWNFNWQGISEQVQDSTIKVHELSPCCYDSTELITRLKPQERVCKWLRKNSTDEEMLILLDFPNTSIKSTCYLGLLLNQKQDNFKLITQLINDSTSYYIEQQGCIGKDTPLSQLVFKYKFGYDDGITTPPKNNIFEHFGLTKEETDRLIELYKKRISTPEKYLELNNIHW